MTPLTKITLNIFAGFILAILAYFFGIRPILSDVKNINLSMSAKQIELDKTQKQIVEFQSAQKDLAKATFKDDIFGTIVVREDLSSAITELESAGKETGIIESIQIAEDETAEAKRTVKTIPVFKGLTLSKEVNYSMSVKGEFPNFINFLQYMENLPHFTEFSAITLNSVTENLLVGIGETKNTGGVVGTLEGVFLVKQNAKK